VAAAAVVSPRSPVAIPKSAIFTEASSPTSRLDGLMSRGGLRGDLGDARKGQWPFLTQFLSQAGADNQLHHQEAAALRDPDVIDRHHVRVAQAGGDTRLVLKPAHRVRGTRPESGQQLHGHRPAQPQVPGSPHLTHAAPPQQGVQSIAVSQHHGAGLLSA
jgi:hypothetical protein